MNIVTSNSSDRAMVHIRNRRSQEAVRWYVLTLPTAVGGRDNIYSSKGLDAELSRRKRCGEPLFEYFAPLVCRGSQGGRQDGQYEEASFIQLCVYPCFGE